MPASSRRSTKRPGAWLLRLVTAVMLLVIGIDHLHLYLGTYQHIPKIGPLFLANLGIAVVLAALILIRPLAILAVGAILFALGTAAFYIYSLQAPLFQFMEAGISYSGEVGLVAEAVTVLAAAALILRRRLPGASRPSRDTGDADRWVRT